MLTSILTRRREFAMLQSIGMTTKQLRRMLMTEGLYYTAAAGFLSLALGSILSLVITDGLLSNLWFFTYTFTLLPLLLVIPLLLLIGALIPVIVLQSVKKQSIVDRLERENREMKNSGSSRKSDRSTLRSDLFRSFHKP